MLPLSEAVPDFDADISRDKDFDKDEVGEELLEGSTEELTEGVPVREPRDSDGFDGERENELSLIESLNEIEK